MFRINKTEWINAKTASIEHVEIFEAETAGKTTFYVTITTKNSEYDSEYFDTFNDAEDYVQNLCDAIKF